MTDIDFKLQDTEKVINYGAKKQQFMFNWNKNEEIKRGRQIKNYSKWNDQIPLRNIKNVTMHTSNKTLAAKK